MDNRERFAAVLAEFGRSIGKTLELSDEDNTCSFMVDDDVAVNLVWLPTAEKVMVWTSVGALPEDEHREPRARRLLEMMDGGRETMAFTLSMSREDRRVLAHDIRNPHQLDTPDRLAVWVDALVVLVRKIRDEFEREYPYWDDSEIKEPEADAD